MTILKSFLYADPLFQVFCLYSFLIIFLSFFILNKLRTITVLKKNMNYLNQIIQELDHEAKLIIKSDMELKLYREEIEDKLNKLTLLKSLMFSSLHILDKEQLLSQIDGKNINSLGFKRGLVFTFDTLEIKTNISVNPHDMETVKRFFIAKKAIIKTIPLLSSDTDLCKELASSLGYKDFLIAPIKARETLYALFFVSGHLIPTPISRAEKEIVSIVCTYLGQCLDNITLFEELYHTKDELEKKVKERTNELVRSLREIETISKLKSDFISSVSHELRTPLTSVKGFSSLLVEEKFGTLPPQAKKRLEKIDDNVDKLVNMVNTLLDIAHIESGKIEIKIAPSDIAKLIREVADFLTPQIQIKNLSLKLNLPKHLLVMMDKNLIERVLVNLLNNAIKFTPEGGTLIAQCKEHEGSALVAIADTGYGIEKESIEKIFQEFFRVDNPVNREIKGSGLGLSLVKRIIDTHKEKIWVESKIGKGTTFYFTLKLVEKK